MLKFNRGLLIPNINIPSSIQELESEFVLKFNNTIRTNHFNNYMKYSDDLKKACGGINLVQWVDGSFVTRINHPHDIDLVTFIDYKTINKFGASLDKFHYPDSLNYNIDAYITVIYPVNHTKNNFYKSNVAYWMNLFDKAKRNRRGIIHAKGFLEIIY